MLMLACEMKVGKSSEKRKGKSPLGRDLQCVRVDGAIPLHAVLAGRNYFQK